MSYTFFYCSRTRWRIRIRWKICQKENESEMPSILSFFFYHFPWIIPFKNVHCFTSETHFHGGREKTRRQPSIKMKNLESRKCGAHFFIPWYIKNQLWLGLYHKGKCMVLFFDIRWCSMFDLPYSFLCHHKIFIFIWKQIKINFCVTFNNVCGFYACVLFYIYFHLMPQSTHFL